jgi:uncharacterized protein YutE (UPF0331/DUF86 family)
LDSTFRTAETEKEVLDTLSEALVSGGELDRIQLRAARASLQILIENAIGKARRILKQLNCPVVPTRSRDPFIIMHEIGLVSDETYQALMQAVGFRNTMIHDYMNFDEKVLVDIVRQRRYMDLHAFLVERPEYSEILRRRIENYSV